MKLLVIYDLKYDYIHFSKVIEHIVVSELDMGSCEISHIYMLDETTFNKKPNKRPYLSKALFNLKVQYTIRDTLKQIGEHQADYILVIGDSSSYKLLGTSSEHFCTNIKDDNYNPYIYKLVPAIKKFYKISCKEVKAYGYKDYYTIIQDPKNHVKNICDILFDMFRDVLMHSKHANYIFNNVPDYIEKYNNVVQNIEKGIDVEYEVLNTIQDVMYHIDLAVENKIFCFDFETTGLEWYRDDIVPTVLCFSYEEGMQYAIPLIHNQSPFGSEQLQEIFSYLGSKIFNNEAVEKIGHNIKFDLHFILKYCGIDNIKGRCNDTMLMHHILDENPPHGLKALVRTFLKKYSNYEEIVADSLEWSMKTLDNLIPYCCIDVEVTFKLYNFFENKLVQDNKLYILYRSLTIPSMLTFLYAEHRGAKIDRKYIDTSIEDAQKVLNNLLSEIHKLPEYIRYLKYVRYKEYKKMLERNENCKITDIPLVDLNFRSSAQMKEFLYSEYGLNLPLYYDVFQDKYIKTTNRGHLRTYSHPFLTLLFAYRTTKGMVSSFFVGIRDKLDKNDFLHGNFLIHGTKTGRLSCKEPNFQNFPSRVQLHNAEVIDIFKRTKRFFIPISEEHVVVQADYSQAELRTIANISGDEKMIQIYIDGDDIHTHTGAKICRMSLEDFKNIDKNEFKRIRVIAKGANFSLVYATSYRSYDNFLKTSTGEGISEEEYKIHYEAIFGTYTKLKKWHNTYIERGRKYGYVRTMFGRKRHLPNINNQEEKSLSSADERISINSPIQGTSAEWTIFAACIISQLLPNDCYFFNNIHDALYFYLKKDKVDACLQLIHIISSFPPVESYFNISEERVPVKMLIEPEISAENWDKCTDYTVKPNYLSNINKLSDL